jgi:hypothetical protein
MVGLVGFESLNAHFARRQVILLHPTSCSSDTNETAFHRDSEQLAGAHCSELFRVGKKDITARIFRVPVNNHSNDHLALGIEGCRCVLKSSGMF